MQFDFEDEVYMKVLELKANHKEELEACKEQQKAFEQASVEEFKAHTKYYRQSRLFSKLLKQELNNQKLNGHELDPYQAVLLELLPH